MSRWWKLLYHARHASAVQFPKMDNKISPKLLNLKKSLTIIRLIGFIMSVLEFYRNFLEEDIEYLFILRNFKIFSKNGVNKIILDREFYLLPN